MPKWSVPLVGRRMVWRTADAQDAAGDLRGSSCGSGIHAAVMDHLW